MIRIHSIVPESIVDGPGIRAAIFTQGCAHKCPGCHNPDTWDFNGGKEVSEEYILDEIHKNPLITGVTFTGGDPVYQWKQLSELVETLKTEKYHLMLYTGFSMEELFLIPNLPVGMMEMAQDSTGVFIIKKDDVKYTPEFGFIHFLCDFDVIITDPFIEERKSAELRHRGSTNQRVWKIHTDYRFVDSTQRTMRQLRVENITKEWDEECQTCDSKPTCERKADILRGFFPMSLCGSVREDD